jgi:predicted Zn-dependent protease
MVARLTADGRGDRYTFHVTVIDDSLVNAMAAPGGQLVFFHGLLDAAATPEELAGVVAHEVQHVVLRHGTAGILRQIPLRLLVAAVTGGGGIGDHAIGAAATLGTLAYARGDEESADREGMRMLQAARVGTDGMVSFMGKLASLNGVEGDPGLANYLSTHPASADRARVLAELATAVRYSAVPLLSEAEWAAVRAPCAR